jgi:hypothetical protein
MAGAAALTATTGAAALPAATGNGVVVIRRERRTPGAPERDDETDKEHQLFDPTRAATPVE